jgi:hypothetical protein
VRVRRRKYPQRRIVGKPQQEPDIATLRVAETR